MNTNDIKKLRTTNIYNLTVLDKYQIDNINNTDSIENVNEFSLFHGIYYDIFSHYNSSFGESELFKTEQEFIQAVNLEYFNLKTSLLADIKDFNSKLNCSNQLELVAKYHRNDTMMFLDSYLEIKTLNSKIITILN